MKRQWPRPSLRVVAGRLCLDQNPMKRIVILLGLLTPELSCCSVLRSKVECLRKSIPGKFLQQNNHGATLGSIAIMGRRCDVKQAVKLRGFVQRQISFTTVFTKRGFPQIIIDTS